MPIPAANDGTLDPVCKLPKEVGPCRAAVRRWTYDLSKGQCVEFTYGGCLGNANNFKTKEACEAKCGGQSESKDDSIPESGADVVDTTVCQLPLEQGNCRASIQRWGFDASRGRCVQFIYGGCGGNANNFESKEACEQRCIANIPMPIPVANDETLDPVCKLPKDVGPCRAAVRRWTYDLSNGQCVEFTYGGCRGNANNFETKEACEAKCGGK
uniref:Kunitz/Bovine pancreatic trypsin inhibitor domain protein n=1 Tax=Mesocestoides corti TaxID=53468 RepID=A0A5K3G6L6_MESCO